VRMVRTLRAELGTKHGTVQRVARQLGTASSRRARGCVRPTSTTGTRLGSRLLSRSGSEQLDQENRELKRAKNLPRQYAQPNRRPGRTTAG